MKKLVLSVAIVMSAFQPVLAGEGHKVKVVSNDTTSSKVLFNVESQGSDMLSVYVEGIQGEMTSISLIDRKGETKYFSFVKSSADYFEINLKDIKPGMYYVKLNMDSEIRMKLVVIEKQ